MNDIALFATAALVLFVVVPLVFLLWMSCVDNIELRGKIADLRDREGQI